MTARLWPSFPLLLLLAALPGTAQRSLEQVRQQESGREWRECAPEALRRLQLSPGQSAADVGAGYGYYSEQIARLVGPTGHVYAVDLDSDSLRVLRDRAASLPPGVLSVIEGRADDPRLPAGSLDAILIVRAYHDMAEPRPMLQRMFQALRPGGRLVMLDHRPRGENGNATRSSQVSRHEIAIGLAAAELRQAGFEILEQRNSVCEGQPDADQRGARLWLLVAARPGAS